MLQIRIPDANPLGPFNTIEKLGDRYDCNNGEMHLPFTVVGDNCVIEAWVEPPPPESEIISEPEAPATPA
jgi:hypothetical protein